MTGSTILNTIDLAANYYMESYNSLETSVFYNDGSKFNQFILLYYKPEDGPEQWSVITQATYYDIDLVLYKLSEEQYFQLSTVWKVPFNMEFICALQRYVIEDKENWEMKSNLEASFNVKLEY